MTNDEGQVAFDFQVDSWVRNQVLNRSRRWHELIANLPGVYPDVALASARRQGFGHLIDFTADSSRQAETKRLPFACRLWRKGRLPTPHPLDGCWWFSDSALFSLVRRITTLCKPGGRVILLGAPTVFHAFARSTCSNGEVVLIDSDREIGTQCTDQGRVIVADLLRDELVGLSADLVVADPPWYDPEVKSFLWAARALCSSRGVVLVSAPPVGSRPGISQQWREIVTWVAGLGLELSQYQRGVLRYLSPPFERNALLAAGTPIPDDEWRQGDLATFRVSGPITLSRPSYDNSDTWDECSVRGVRFRVRIPIIDDGCDAGLHPFGFGEILDSVSRRDPRRSQVDVWTSGNRVFRCGARRTLVTILQGLASNREKRGLLFETTNRSFTINETMRRMIDYVERIVQAERQEYLATMETYGNVDALAS
jgi:hypothetical protein